MLSLSLSSLPMSVCPYLCVPIHFFLWPLFGWNQTPHFCGNPFLSFVHDDHGQLSSNGFSKIKIYLHGINSHKKAIRCTNNIRLSSSNTSWNSNSGRKNARVLNIVCTKTDNKNKILSGDKTMNSSLFVSSFFVEKEQEQKKKTKNAFMYTAIKYVWPRREEEGVRHKH